MLYRTSSPFFERTTISTCFLNPLFMSSIHAVAAESGIIDGTKSATLTHSTCRGQAT